MADETLLVALLGGLHLLGFVFAGLMLLPLMRDERIAPVSRRDEDEGGGGGSDRLPPTSPHGPRPGGVPLPDAAPARVRLREGQRLADLLPRIERRPTHAPAPAPTRTPVER